MDPFKTIGYLLKDVSRRYAARFERHGNDVDVLVRQQATDTGQRSRAVWQSQVQFGPDGHPGSLSELQVNNTLSAGRG